MSDTRGGYEGAIEAARALRNEFSEDAVSTMPDVSERTLYCYQKFASHGLQSLLIPESEGGYGCTYHEAGLVMEDLSYDLIGALPSLITTMHCIELIRLSSDENRKKKLLKRVLHTAKPLSFCLTEEEAGSDIGGIKSTALKTKKDVRLHGRKTVVISSTVAQLYLVFATVSRGQGRAGINVFSVEQGSDGLMIEEPYQLDGFHNSVMGPVAFHNVLLSDENRLSREGVGYFMLIECLDKGRPLVAASCVGAAQKVMDIIVQYTKKRSQFNKPLAYFQGITFPLAEYATRLHAARLLYRDALQKIDNGDPFTMEASMAKHYASMLLEDLSSFGMEVLGYRGMSQRNPVKQIYHDAQLLKSIDGTANVQRMIIASQL